MHVRTRLEYRAAFVLDRIAQIVSYGTAFATIFLLLHRFGALGGWRWPDMAMLLSFGVLSYALGAAFSFVQFREMEEMVRLGTFDVLLVKPFSPWAYIVFSGLNADYIGHIVISGGLLIWAITQSEVTWDLATIVYFIAALCSAALVVAAMITMIGASALVLVQARALYAIFFGFWELTRLPMTILPSALQILLLTAVPLGFMGYVPVAVLLDKEVPFLPMPWAAVASLVAGPILALIAAVHWRLVISKYQGAGG